MKLKWMFRAPPTNPIRFLRFSGLKKLLRFQLVRVFYFVSRKPNPKRATTKATKLETFFERFPSTHPLKSSPRALPLAPPQHHNRTAMKYVLTCYLAQNRGEVQHNKFTH